MWCGWAAQVSREFAFWLILTTNLLYRTASQVQAAVFKHVDLLWLSLLWRKSLSLDTLVMLEEVMPAILTELDLNGHNILHLV